MSEEELSPGCSCAILAAIGLTIGGIILCCRGCGKEEPKQEQKQSSSTIEFEDQGKRSKDMIEFKQHDLENMVQNEKTTILTQITDVQPRMIPYEISGREKIAVYTYVQISGGDVKEASLIIPGTAGELLKKYTPVKITYTKLNSRTIPAQELVRRHYCKEGTVPASETIKADGIIEQSGIQYIEEKK